MFFKNVLSIALVVVLPYVSTCCAQDVFGEGRTFELSAPGVGPSIVDLSASELVIRDSLGMETRYKRAPRYDTADGSLLGYSSREAQQIIRWPVSNQGRLQIGTLQRDKIHFAWSKMTIAASLFEDENASLPIDPIPHSDDEILPPAITAVHLATGDELQRQFLTMRGASQFGFSNQASGIDSAWYITPISDGLVRLQQRHQDEWLAIGIGGSMDVRDRIGARRVGGLGGRNGFPLGAGNGISLSLLPLQNGVEQMWRIQNLAAGGYCFESVLYPGMGLTCVPNSGITLQPLTFDPLQMWWPSTPAFALPQPQMRTVQQQVISNPPLPPAEVIIANSHSDALMVLLADRRNPTKPQKMKVAAGGSERVQMERDPGATIVETIETLDGFGNWQTHQFTTPIPPNVLYDISVYEEFLQSIAIDRTGKSPNPIEDVNYQPRSIGFFLVPAGDDLPQVSEMDVYHIALDEQNPGAVRRLSQRDLERSSNAPATDPLKDLLKQFQKQRGAF